MKVSATLLLAVMGPASAFPVGVARLSPASPLRITDTGEDDALVDMIRLKAREYVEDRAYFMESEGGTVLALRASALAPRVAATTDFRIGEFPMMAGPSANLPQRGAPRKSEVAAIKDELVAAKIRIIELESRLAQIEAFAH